MQKINLKNRKGQNMVGVLEKPEGEIKGTCLVMHGWGGNKGNETTQSMKEGFLQSGFQTFNFDATNSFGESDGDYEKSTLTLHKQDLEDVAKWVQSQEWFVKPFALIGHSMGADAVAEYAEKYPEEVDFVVPVAPTVSGELSFEAHNKFHPGQLEEWKEKDVLEVIGKHGNLKRQHWFQMEDRLNHNLLPNADKLIMPVLLIVGTKDTICPPEHVEKFFEAIPEGNKQIKYIEGAPHSYYEKQEQEACINLIKDWLKEVM